MAIKWLTCNFEPVETASGEMLEGIKFDPEKKRTHIVTVTREKAEKGWVFKPTGPFGVPMTLVFDAAKSRAQLHFPINQPHDNGVTVEVGTVNVHHLSWLFSGALQVTIVLARIRKEFNRRKRRYISGQDG